MIYAKDNPVGIDARIVKMQNKLNSVFQDNGWTNYDIYGRLYLNSRDKDKVFEAHVGDGEYREVFVDDRKSFIVGFYVSENRNGFDPIISDIKLIASCHLENLYGDKVRRDEDTMLTILSALKPFTIKSQMQQVKTGLENVFSNVSWQRYKHRDMQPWFNFSIAFSFSYKNVN